MPIRVPVTSVVRVAPVPQSEADRGLETLVDIVSEKNELTLIPPSTAEEEAQHESVQRTLAFGAPSTPSRPTSSRQSLATPWRTQSRLEPATFTYDHVFGPEATQESVFDVVEPVVGDVLSGRNGTVIAYGSTGAGKTHTILGTPQNEGMLQRSMSALFSRISTDAEAAYKVYVTYVELYVDNFRDLLASDPSTSEKLRIRECKRRGVFVDGSDGVRTPVESWADARKLLERGARNRTVGKTELNHRSSRSHVILTVEVHRTPHVHSAAAASGTIGHTPSRTARLAQAHRRGSTVRTPRRGSVAALPNGTRVSKLRVVDLAGAERVSMSGVAGAGLKEANAINTSLTFLGQVLQALSSKVKTNPDYRSNKLTFYLRDSLGGRARTIMITHIRPTPPHYQHSLLALTYARRVRFIENRVPEPIEALETLGQHASAESLARIADMERALADADKRKAAIEQHLAQAQDEIGQLRTMAVEAMAELEDAVQHQKSAQRRADQAEDTLRAVSAELERERRNADPGLYEEVEAMSQQCATAESTSAEAAARAEAAEQTVLRLEAEANASEGKMEAMEKKFSVAAAAATSAKTELEHAIRVACWERDLAAANGGIDLVREKQRAGAVIWRLARTLKLRELELETREAAAVERADTMEAEWKVAVAQRDILWGRLRESVEGAEEAATAASARIEAAEAKAEAALANANDTQSKRASKEAEVEAEMSREMEALRARVEAAEEKAEAAEIAKAEAEREFGLRLSEVMDEQVAARKEWEKREQRSTQRERARVDAVRATSGVTFKELEESKRLLANSEARAEQLDTELAKKSVKIQKLKEAMARLRAQYVELLKPDAGLRRATVGGPKKRPNPAKGAETEVLKELPCDDNGDTERGEAAAKRARKRSMQDKLRRASFEPSPSAAEKVSKYTKTIEQAGRGGVKDKAVRRLAAAVQHASTDSPSKL